MANTVIYTGIFGDYDDLNDPSYISQNCDYVCFTDNPNIKSKIWKIVSLQMDELPPNLKNRYVKLLPHLFFQNYEYSVYIDGNIDIIADIEPLIEKYLCDSNMACPLHPQRSCIYEEAKACIELKKEDKTKICKQMDAYRKIGYPENNGLTANYILFRRHNEYQVMQVMEDWWNELMCHSKRDQLSFCYIAWKHNFYFNIIDENGEGESYFIRISHKKSIINKMYFFACKLCKSIRY
jgi:hypothetical protein